LRDRFQPSNLLCHFAPAALDVHDKALLVGYRPAEMVRGAAPPSFWITGIPDFCEF
jgi:hypothetical protein